jgi:hypothetical protein
VLQPRMVDSKEQTRVVDGAFWLWEGPESVP